MSTGNGNRRPANGEASPGGLAEKPPPQNLEAERGVLAGILLDNSQMDAVLEVMSDVDLYRDTHQVIFRAMARIHERGEPIDPVSLMEELQRRDQFRLIGGHDTLF